MKKILFFGELPPQTIHGVSFSNEINLQILERLYAVSRIVEYADMKGHKRFTFRKLFQLLGYGLSVISNRIRHGRHDYFYLPFSISGQGVIKDVFLIWIFRRFNPGGRVVMHIFRSDMPVLYAKGGWVRKMVNYLLNVSYAVILLSDNMITDDMRDSFPCFRVVPNTIRPYQGDLSTRKTREFIYISHYIKSKGIFDLLSAMQTVMPDIRLDCYGQFTNEQEKDAIYAYESDRITINPFLPEEEKMKTLSSAECLILPSHTEGQPQVIFEAMAIGIPVIATRVGDIESMLGPSYEFLVDVYDIAQLSAAIDRFYALSRKEREAISAYLVDRFNSLFSMQVHTQGLLNIFDN